MQTIHSLFVLAIQELTHEQTTRLIELGFELIKIMGTFIGIVSSVVTFILYRNQRVNRDILTQKMDENTDITKDVKEHLSLISDLDQIKSMTALAKKTGDVDPVFYTIPLPGKEYELFELSEGEPVYWKSEDCSKGRQVRYKVTGRANMGWHFHFSSEIVIGVKGAVTIHLVNSKVVLGPGEHFETPPDSVHAASFEEAGEAVVHWPDQQTDDLQIGVYP